MSAFSVELGDEREAVLTRPVAFTALGRAGVDAATVVDDADHVLAAGADGANPVSRFDHTMATIVAAVLLARPSSLGVYSM